MLFGMGRLTVLAAERSLRIPQDMAGVMIWEHPD